MYHFESTLAVASSNRSIFFFPNIDLAKHNNCL